MVVTAFKIKIVLLCLDSTLHYVTSGLKVAENSILSWSSATSLQR